MPAISKSKKKYIYLFIRLGVVAGGLLWAGLWLSGEDRWQRLVEIFGKLNLWFFAVAMLIFLLGQTTVAFRWWVLLRTQKVFISFLAAVSLHFLGLFYNNFMPGAVGGDLIRAWYVTKHTHHRFEAALSVFVDRVIGLISTLLIAVVFYSIFLRGKRIVPAEQAGTGQSDLLRILSDYRVYLLWAVGVIAAVFAALLLLRRSRRVLSKIWRSILELAKRFSRKLVTAFFVYCKNPGAILMVFALTVCLQLAQITGFWLVGRDLGVDVSLKFYYVFFTLTWVLGSVPVSISGAVVVEGSLVFMFTQYAGVQAEAALAIALVQRIVWMLASLPGAAIHIFGAHLPKQIAVDYGEDMD